MPFTVTVAPSSPSTAVPKPIISPYCMQLSKEVVKFIIPDNNRAEEFEVVCPSSPPASITVSIFTFISALDTVTLPVALPVIPPQNRAVFKKPVISMLPVCRIPSRRHLFCLQYRLSHFAWLRTCRLWKYSRRYG